MYWHKTKTLLIAVLILANAFLIYRTYAYERSKSYIAEDYAASAAAALEKQGVEIDADAIPLKKPTAPIVVYERGSRLYDSFALRVLGSDGVRETQADGYVSYSYGGAELREYADGRFEYTAQPSGGDESAGERRARSLAETFVELSGLTKSDFEIRDVREDSDGFVVTVGRVYGGVEMIGYETGIHVENNAVVSAEGRLIAGSNPYAIDTDFSDSVNVLFAVAGSEKGIKIDGMELVYVPSENENQTVFTPMYEISSDGNIFRYDLSTSQIIR